jgi:transcription initiation factor IIE alpha subunit
MNNMGMQMPMFASANQQQVSYTFQAVVDLQQTLQKCYHVNPYR